MNMRIKHAVITNKEIVTIDAEARKLCRLPYFCPIQHISDLWALGKQKGITHFWIMPDTDIARMEWAFLAEDRKEYTVFVPGERVGESPRAATCRREWGSLEIVVNYPGNGDGFAWICKHPLDILAAIDYLTQMLCISDIKYSAQSIGKEYLREKYKSTKRLMSYLRKPTQDIKQLPFRAAGQEIFFTRALDASMVGQTFHHYDKNSAHPSAASSMITGVGDPTHLLDDIVPKDPGIYRVTCTKDASVFDGIKLPPIVNSEWITLDLLKFAIKQGCSFEIHEAYIFEQKQNIFGDWARDLWQIRQTLKDTVAFPHPGGRSNAYDTIKDIMNKTISAQKDNPNWWADMVSMARVARLANLKKFAEDGHYPLCVYVDDMAFISSDPNCKTAVPGILDKQDKLGGYKHKYSIEITKEIVENAPELKPNSSANNANRMFEYFKKLARERGLIDE